MSENSVPQLSGLSRVETGELLFSWSDGRTNTFSPKKLRDACPCAGCREKRSAKQEKPLGLPVLSLEQTAPLKVTGMRPVGNYAYNIQFSDGHSSGLFTIESLYRLGQTLTS